MKPSRAVPGSRVSVTRRDYTQYGVVECTRQAGMNTSYGGAYILLDDHTDAVFIDDGMVWITVEAVSEKGDSLRIKHA